MTADRGAMIDPSEYDDIIVHVAHPWGDGYPTLGPATTPGPAPGH